jgi:hypothetical protein
LRASIATPEVLVARCAQVGLVHADRGFQVVQGLLGAGDVVLQVDRDSGRVGAAIGLPSSSTSLYGR